MANTKQAAKRARKSHHQRDANVRLRTTLRTAIKKIHKAIEAGDKAAAEGRATQEPTGGADQGARRPHLTSPHTMADGGPRAAVLLLERG